MLIILLAAFDFDCELLNIAHGLLEPAMPSPVNPRYVSVGVVGSPAECCESLTIYAQSTIALLLQMPFMHESLVHALCCCTMHTVLEVVEEEQWFGGGYDEQVALQ